MKKRPKKCFIAPPPTELICYNRECRRVLRGKFKILEFPDRTKAHLCLHCFDLWAEKNLAPKKPVEEEPIKNTSILALTLGLLMRKM